MSTAHRVLGRAFCHSARALPFHLPLVRPSITPPQSSGSGTWSCTPWEGLYFEEAPTA